METAMQTTLREQADIKELFQVLESSGMTKERQNVGNLVNYLENMETQLGQVVHELKEVQGQISQMQNKGIKSAVAHIVEQAENRAWAGSLIP